MEKKINNKKIIILLICIIVIIAILSIICYKINLNNKEKKMKNDTEEKTNDNTIDNDSNIEYDEDGNQITNENGYKEVNYLLTSDIEGTIDEEEKSIILNLYKESLVTIRCTETEDGNCFPNQTEMIVFSFFHAEAELEHEKFNTTKTYYNTEGIKINLNDYELYDAIKINNFLYERFGVKIDFNKYKSEYEYMHYIPELKIIAGESGGGRGPIFIKSAVVTVVDDIYTLNIKYYNDLEENEDEEIEHNYEMTLKKIIENNKKRFIYVNFKR